MLHRPREAARNRSAPRKTGALLALALALAGCFECKPGDVTTTDHRPICPAKGERQ